MTKTETKSTVLLKHHLKRLKLPTMHAECEKTAYRAATENLDHLAYLLALCESAISYQQETNRRAHARPPITDHSLPLPPPTTDN